jgi:hypothetical protein
VKFLLFIFSVRSGLNKALRNKAGILLLRTFVLFCIFGRNPPWQAVQAGGQDRSFSGRPHA